MSTTPEEPVVPPEDHDSRTDSAADRRADPVVSRTDEEAPEQLELLDDEYAREILTVLSTGPRKGRELAERCGFSRSTVYRRLNRLEDAGLVATDLRIDPGGNHCKEFSLVRDSLRVEIGDGAITVTARQSSAE